MKDFTMELKLARLRLGYSQTKLAEKLELGKQRYLTLENSKIQLDNMPIKRFVKLCEVLDEEFRTNVLNREYLLTMFGSES